MILDVALLIRHVLVRVAEEPDCGEEYEDVAQEDGHPHEQFALRAFISPS